MTTHTEGKRQDYVPANPAEFRSFMLNLMDYVNDHGATWTNIPPDRIKDLFTSFVRFVNVYEKSLKVETPANKLAAREAQAETTHLLRDFVKQYMHFDPITNIDRTEMRIPNHDYIRTPKPRPTEEVETDIQLAGIRRIQLHYKVRGAASRARPYGSAGACVAWTVADKKVSAIEELTHTVFSSKTPHIMTFPDIERGKTVSMAVCWENPKGEKGPWSEIISTIVP